MALINSPLSPKCGAYLRTALIRVINCNWQLKSLLHLGQIVITLRTLLHLGQNVITFRTLLHLGSFITFRPSTWMGRKVRVGGEEKGTPAT